MVSFRDCAITQLFFLLVFGKLVEEEEGAWGLIISYLICGIGGNIASVIMLGKQVGTFGGWCVLSVDYRFWWERRK